MDGICGEIARFLREKKERQKAAGQLAALQIACHIDISDALQAAPMERVRIILRLERLLERERLRGARHHWSYDLNRHIALKQALDRLRKLQGDESPIPVKRSRDDDRPKTNGARRRRLKLGSSGCLEIRHP